MTVALFILDPLDTLHTQKDTSIFLIEEALARDITVWVTSCDQLFSNNDHLFVKASHLTRATYDASPWYVLGETRVLSANEIDIILMRKDPPFNLNYVLTTYLLDLAVRAGVQVVNHPQALRDFNEKCAILQFADCIAETALVGNLQAALQFLETHQDVVLKSLTVMGGQNIFHLQAGEVDVRAKIENLLAQEAFVMMQKFMPQIYETGDSRITLMAGEPLPYKLVRFPKANDFRANLAQGGSYQVMPLTERDWQLCRRVQPVLKGRGLHFVGLDVVGECLTEVNVTCPTGLREVCQAVGLNGVAIFWETLGL